MRALLAALAVLVAWPPAAHAATVRLARGATEPAALTVAGGRAWVVLRSGSSGPFTLVRADGRRARRIGAFAAPGTVFPDAATAPGGRVLVSWGRTISAGEAYELTAAPPVVGGAFGPLERLGDGTGPGRLAVAGTTRLLAHPDRLGDAVLTAVAPGGAPALTTLTTGGLERRQLPLDIALDGAGRPLVLSVEQAAAGTALRVLGDAAPAAPVLERRGLREVAATLAAEGDGRWVAYLDRGRARLASALGTGPWQDERLPGPGGGTGAPAVLRAGGHTLVVYAQRAGGRRDLYLATLGGGRPRVRRLTATPGEDDTHPLAAARDGAVYVAWARTAAGARRASAAAMRVRP